MAENEKSQEEIEDFKGREALSDNQAAVLRQAKSRFGILSIVIVLLLILGAGGFIFFFVGDRIKVEMVKVEKQILEKTRNDIKDELSASKAVDNEKILVRKIYRETDQNTEAIDKLGSAIMQAKNQAAQLEERLADIRKSLYAQSEKVQKEARQLVKTSEIRVHDLENTVETMAQDLKTLYESEDEFKRNARYEIQITYERGSEDIVDYLGGLLRNQGFHISTWPNIDKINAVYGISMESLESKISILPAPGEPVIGENISRILRVQGGVPVVRTGVDKAANSRPNLVGLLIPPGCSLPSKLMKASLKRKG